MKKSIIGKIFKGVFIVFFTLSIVLYSDKMSSAASYGLELWLNTVVPSLFPFMVISSWLSFSIPERKTHIDRITLSLFGVPSSLMAIFPVSLLSGYPVGAKIISNLYLRGDISRDTAEHLLSFCNNPGAIFIISAVASSMLDNRPSSLFFIIVCVISSLTNGILYNFVFPAEALEYKSSRKPVKSSVYSAISSAVGSILLVGGCIVFFSVISEAVFLFFSVKNPLVDTIISGLLEFTQGIRKASDLNPSLAYPIICVFLCWGGMSVHLQTAAIIGDCGISIKKYLVGKAFCAACAYIIAVTLYDVFFPFQSSKEYISAFSPIRDGASIFAFSVFLASAVFLVLGEKRRRK